MTFPNRPSSLALVASILLAAPGPAPLRAQQFGPPEARPELPAPFDTKSVVHRSSVIGWPEGKTPVAAAGLRVTEYAELRNPRWLYLLPNGDLLVSQASTEFSSPNTVTLLRDVDGDGRPELRETFLERLNKPFGMVLLGDSFYLGETNKLSRYPYQTGQTRLDPAQGKKILDLPAGGYNNHWTRNVIAHPNGKKLLVSVGSGSNVGENGIDNEFRRACVIEINPDGSGERLLAGGLRNPVGLDFAPGTDTLWTVVNERDGLGDDLVPDYLTSVKAGSFYGWPYAYYGQTEDPRRRGERPDLVARSVKPDYALGSHTASLGLTFSRGGDALPARYRQGVFIGQRGSWNRSEFSGYKVVFVPFDDNNRPSGPPRDILTGFIADAGRREVYGRPVGVAMLKDGSLLVADEPGNKIWRVTASAK